MITNRLFIFRVNGNDNFIADDPEKARQLYEMFEENDIFKYERTEINSLTTTYYFIIR